MNDAILLSIMVIKENLNKYGKYIAEHTISQETKTLLKDFAKFFEENPSVDRIDLPAFSTWFKLMKHPGMKPDKVMIFDKLLTLVEKEIVSPSYITANVIDYFIALDYANRIRHEAEQFIYGAEDDMTKVVELAKEYSGTATITSHDEHLFASTELETLVETTVSSKGLEWRLPEFNEILGPLRKGDFIIIAARPETGKTTTLCSEVTHMAPQLEKEQCVLWVCNEESGNKVQFRIFQAAIGKTKAEILLNVPAAKVEIATALGGSADKIKVMHKPYMDYKEVDAVCQRLNPGLIIFDQLDKIHGFFGERDDIKLQKLYQWAREKANEYGPVISISQCDGTAENQRYIQMSQLAGSKTGKQGEADAIIMLGVDPDPAYEFVRFINVPKNKLAGGPSSIEEARHGRAEIIIDPARARIKSPRSKT